MKLNLVLALFAVLSFVPGLANADSTVVQLPEPSSLALYGAAAVALVLARKFRS